MGYLVYKKGGPHKRPVGTVAKLGKVQGVPSRRFQWMGLDTEEDYKKAKEEGWCDSVEQAIEGAEDVQDKKEKSILREEAEEKVVDDGEDFRRYDELTTFDKATILADAEQMTDKEVREKHNIHHFTLKKLKDELD